MDQSVIPSLCDRPAATAALIEALVVSIQQARAVEKPFFHLQFDHVFPEAIYSVMMVEMPNAGDYRPMNGRRRLVDLANGVPTRVKIDLFPEYIRHLPPRKLDVWRVVGDALCSEPVKEAFRAKLAPGLEKRFGKGYKTIGLYPIPILTRDIPGYQILPHTDTHWKGVTVQLYLPPDDANTDIGTIFHDVLPDGSTPKASKMRFGRNTGYAFAVGDDTWHSADTVREGIKTRDSILLTYFLDDAPLKVLRNRGKRFGNFVLNEVRRLK